MPPRLAAYHARRPHIADRTGSVRVAFVTGETPGRQGDGIRTRTKGGDRGREARNRPSGWRQRGRRHGSQARREGGPLSGRSGGTGLAAQSMRPGASGEASFRSRAYATAASKFNLCKTDSVNAQSVPMGSTVTDDLTAYELDGTFLKVHGGVDLPLLCPLRAGPTPQAAHGAAR
jgi:hypothetical protein